MTNYEYLCNNKLELAKMLVQGVTEIEYDYDWDENSIPYEEYYYECSDGERYYHFDKKEAIKHELEWLESEMKEK